MYSGLTGDCYTEWCVSVELAGHVYDYYSSIWDKSETQSVQPVPA